MMPFRQCRLFLLSAMVSLLGACANTPTPADAAVSLAATKGLIASKTLKISDSVSIALEKLVFWGGYGAAAYLILDPLAPNWEIEEAAFPDNYYHFNLRMKRFYSGGAGEARVVFQQRAKELMRRGGFDGYQVLEYSEGLESSFLGSQRVTEGVIQLTRK